MKLPPIGQVLASLEGQRYKLDTLKPYTRVDGTESRILTWSSDCKSCGERFTLTSGLNPETRRFARNCKACRTSFVPSGSTADEVQAARNQRWSEQLKAWNQEARDVKAGKAELRPVKLKSALLHASGAFLNCDFRFNDKDYRTARYYPSGRVECEKAQEADFTEYLAPMHRLFEAETAKRLFL